ncbi:hypothetical protein, partial [Cryobacterium sp. Y50]|uniref:hypothetical protein n=1 Tax=Cryobacterium sp. Y50 TaxID=2048286 RepID=UPI001E452313
RHARNQTPTQISPTPHTQGGPVDRGLVAVLAGTLILLGLSALFLAPELGGISGWLGAAVFLLFAVLLFGAQDDVRAIIQ